MAAGSIVVFGGRGAIGSAAVRHFAAQGWRVTATSRSALTSAAAAPTVPAATRWVVCNPLDSQGAQSALAAGGPYDAVCWAQGMNLSDSVFDVDPARHLELYRANCVFVLESLQWLLAPGLLNNPARLVVVSSIWQRIARQNKLSYIMSKAALGGLVQSASVDLAARGVLINAVLPAVLDTPMTAANLSPAQVKQMADATGFGRLTSLQDVVNTIAFLCSDQNTGVTGQSVGVDLGYTHARLV